MLNFKVVKYLIAFVFFFNLSNLYGEETAEENSLKEQARIYRQEGYKLQSKGDLKESLVYYFKAVYSDPYYVEPYNDIGVVYESWGENSKAVSMYKKALEVDNKYLPAYANLALLYERRGDFRKAAYYWKNRLELGEQGEYWYQLSKEHLEKLSLYPQVKKAMVEESAAKFIVELRRARKQQKIEKARVHFEMGNVLFKKNDYKSAFNEFKKARVLKPLDKVLRKKIDDAYKKAAKVYIKEQSFIKTN